MKRALFLCLLGVGSAFVALQAQGALTGLNVTLPVGNPGYADFNMNGLRTTYSYNTTTKIGTFTVSNVSGTQGEQYTSSPSSPGTGGNPYSNQQFQGTFNMTANVMLVGSEWQVQSGSTIMIKGNLINGADTADILLNGNLVTGSGSFGWGTKADDEFDFLFNTASGGSDNQAILSDFFGVGTGLGAMKFHEGTGTTYNGNLATGWASAGGGFVDAFVPEPVFYPLAAAGMAMLGFGLATRKSGAASPVAA
jgi:hypothetical protein